MGGHVSGRVHISGADARQGARASHRRQVLLVWPIGPDLLNLAQGRPQVGQPGLLVLTDEAHAPGESVTAATGHAGVNESVKHPSLGLPKAGHNRH